MASTNVPETWLQERVECRQVEKQDTTGKTMKKSACEKLKVDGRWSCDISAIGWIKKIRSSSLDANNPNNLQSESQERKAFQNNEYRSKMFYQNKLL